MLQPSILCHVVSGLLLTLDMCIAAGAQTGAQTGQQPNFDIMSVHDLKQYLTGRGISLAGLNEKSELIAKAKAAG